jgi:indolepyruvate ferredoxin oxidoreductase, beta subunit
MTNILLSGVGGQGIITASKVIAEAALLSGIAIKKSEIHGMSQRGGSVESHVRISSDGAVYSPTIPAGEVDVLLAFEILEALRAVPLTRPNAAIFADDRRIVPSSVTSGAFEYPADPVADLRASGRRVAIVPSFEIALALGEQRAANLVMLGAASGLLTEVDPAAWTEAIRHSVRPKLVGLNLAAFQAGIKAMGKDS